ncbi:MAG TPA: RsmE family RNA methyltransferase, partial [Spirochaetota bacterium]|nr:RsmE family RNA methyltransferase [Spirochaetota bacterium]
QKAVEVGVSSIIPLVTERTIVELKGKDNEKRERWRKIAEEASKQSMRDSLPVVEHPMTFDDFLKAHADVPVRIITAPGERDYTLRSALEQQKGNRAALLVGPEGGFSADEILRAEAAGFICVVVGSTQMRAETAGIVLPALLRYELEARFGDER